MNIGVGFLTVNYEQKIQHYSKQLQAYDSCEALGPIVGAVTSFVKIDLHSSLPFYTFYPTDVNLISKRISNLNLIKQDLAVLEKEVIKAQHFYLKAQADQMYMSLIQDIQKLKALQANYSALFEGHLKRAKEYQFEFRKPKTFTFIPYFGPPSI